MQTDGEAEGGAARGAAIVGAPATAETSEAVEKKPAKAETAEPTASTALLAPSPIALAAASASIFSIFATEDFTTPAKKSEPLPLTVRPAGADVDAEAEACEVVTTAAPFAAAAGAGGAAVGRGGADVRGVAGAEDAWGTSREVFVSIPIPPLAPSLS